MARPKKNIDPEMVKKLASIFCTSEEIGTIVGCSKDTLEKRFSAALKEGRSQGKMSLRRKQFELAMKGNLGMLVWLGKQYLYQSEKIETVNENVQVIVK